MSCHLITWHHKHGSQIVAVTVVVLLRTVTVSLRQYFTNIWSCLPLFIRLLGRFLHTLEVALANLPYKYFQTQLAWSQHDAGHLSVFKSTYWNRVYHKFLFCVMKAVSTTWWNHLHYQHHSKPNVVSNENSLLLLCCASCILQFMHM